ncbi:MAG: hypothetical protein ACK5V3_15715 [Bdellovibrionales bacterium]
MTRVTAAARGYAFASDRNTGVFSSVQTHYGFHPMLLKVCESVLTKMWELENPNPNGSVDSIYVNGSTIYIGGQFTNTGDPGKSRQGFSKFDSVTGADLWTPL